MSDRTNVLTPLVGNVDMILLKVICGYVASFKIGYLGSYLILWSRALNNTVVKVLLKDKLRMLVL